MRCWWCGVAAVHLLEDLRLCRAEPAYVPVWPEAAADHDHAERPPTVDQLVDEAFRLLAAR